GRPQSKLRIALVNAREEFLERVRLQETIVAAVPPRIPSISSFLAGTNIELIRGSAIALDADRKRVRIASGAQERELAFGEAIHALVSHIDVDEVPGAAEHAYRLDPGDGPRSAAALRMRLRDSAGRPARIVIVGGAETGIEVAGEIKAAWPAAELALISRSRCGDVKGPRVERAVRAALSRLGVTLVDGETVTDVHAREVITQSGRSIACDICVWSGGLRAAPIASAAGLATDPQGRIWVDPNLRSISHPHIV